LGTDSGNALQGSKNEEMCCHLHSVPTVPHCAVAASVFIFLTVQVSLYPNTLVHDVQTRSFIPNLTIDFKPLLQ